ISPGQPMGFVSYPDFEDFRVSSFAGITAQTLVLIAIDREVRTGLAVTADYFDVLGVRSALGRTFRKEEDREPVVVLAYDFWRSRPVAIGTQIRLAGSPFTVIGVAPKDFGLDRFIHEDFYVPIGAYAAGRLPSTGRPLEDRARRFLSVYARLAPGVSIA